MGTNICQGLRFCGVLQRDPRSISLLQVPRRRFCSIRKTINGSNLAAEFLREGLYRPVGVFIVEDLKGRCLLVRSAKVDVWSYPQGGIEEGETLEANMLRELQEEVNIGSSQLKNIATGLFVGKVDFPASRKVRRGFSKGKAYFFGYGRVISPVDLVVQSGEVADAKWVNRSDVDPFLKRFNSPDKYQLLHEATNVVIREQGIKIPGDGQEGS